MPRTIEISAPPEKIDAVVARLRGIEGIVGCARYPGASLMPPGDVLSVQATNEATRSVLSLLKDCDVPGSGSVQTSALSSLLSSQHQRAINDESNETVWDEMANMLRTDTNPSANFLIGMALAGAIAAVGLWTDTLHIVVGAMVVAPAFEPLARIPFAFISGARSLVRGGLIATFAGYTMLAMGAALATLCLEATSPLTAGVLVEQPWVQYWSTVTFPGVLSSAFGGLAGAILLSGQRSVLTTGVMIALALIPSLSLVGMGFVKGDLVLASRGALRWGVDVVLVLLMSALVFGFKRRFLHRRHALS